MEADEMRLYFPMNIEKREVTRWFVSIIGSQLIYIYIYIYVYIYFLSGFIWSFFSVQVLIFAME